MIRIHPPMPKTILLINPWIYDFSAYDFWNKPLGLLYLASFLRNNGYGVNFIDALDTGDPFMREDHAGRPPRRFAAGHGNYFKEIIPKPTPLRDIPKNYHRYGITPQVFRRRLLSLTRPDLVLVTSMMTYWYPGVFATIELVKDVFPGIPVVLGGNYVSLCPDHAKLSGADFLLTGAGEIKLAGLLETLWGDRISCLPDPDKLDSYPYPAYDLLFHPEQLPLLTSRGCPLACSYCASKLLNPTFRRRNPVSVFAEILSWHRRLGVRHFSLYDDAFLVQPGEMALPLLKECVKQQLPLSFHCPNGLHLREINDEIATLLFRSGFKTMRFGFETANPDRQGATGGKVTNQDLQLAVKALQKAGYQGKDIGIYILCGLPGQRAEEVKETILFVKSCGARPVLAEYSPIPHTALWQSAQACSPFPIAAEPLYQNNSILPCRNALFTYDMYRSLKLLAAEG